MLHIEGHGGLQRSILMEIALFCGKLGDSCTYSTKKSLLVDISFSMMVNRIQTYNSYDVKEHLASEYQASDLVQSLRENSVLLVQHGEGGIHAHI